MSGEFRVGIAGVGTMGGIVLDGLLRSGWDPARVVVSGRTLAKTAAIAERTGVLAATTADLAGQVDVIVVGVKPHDVPAALAEMSGTIRPGTVVASMAAGLSCASLEAGLPEGTPVVRAMPNTPAALGAGVTGLSGGRYATEESLRLVGEVMSSVGTVVTIPESGQDALTAVSGSGPAYVFYVADAMIEAGVHLGLTRQVATELVGRTLLGASRMLVESDEHPVVLREKVTSPGGTTAAALRVLDDRAVRGAFLEALEACRDRSAEFGRHG